MATIATRLLGLEDLKDTYNKKGKFKDVEGWALPYVNIASEKGLMAGTSENTFKPEDDLTYVEVLTVLMRALGYEDGIDFKNYPDDYYNKALEIGLADLYIKDKEVISRSIASKAIDKALELDVKSTNTNLRDKLNKPLKKNPVKELSPEKEISLENLEFTTSIVGIFSGKLKGLNDFTGYKIELLSKEGQVYKNQILDKSGKFKITGFDIDLFSKLSGYMYKIYDAKGNLILSSDLK